MEAPFTSRRNAALEWRTNICDVSCMSCMRLSDDLFALCVSVCVVLISGGVDFCGIVVC